MASTDRPTRVRVRPMRMLECDGSAWFVSSTPFRGRRAPGDARLLFYCIATRERIETSVIWPAPVENAPDDVLRTALQRARHDAAAG